jgi:hypothetical protein
MIATPPPESSPSLAVLEFGLTLIAVPLALLWPSLAALPSSFLERLFQPLARRKALAVAFVGLLAFVLRVAMLPLVPIPRPFIPDDFSFLLSADTFAHGRLANPTPAMWVHFETIHVSMTPTYMSMYFPGQGLLLAAGKVLLGHEWYAVLIATALMCAAITWMLQAWLPPNWALLGGLISVLHLGLFCYWTNSYTGAAQLAAIGGSLVLGALPRFRRHVRGRDALWMSLGMILMAVSRPSEGVLLCIPVCVVLLRWIFFGPNKPGLGLAASRLAVPLVLLAAAVAWMGYYDYRAFGNPLTPPYTVNRAQYAVAPYYVWQHPRPNPGYHHPVMERFYYDNELGTYEHVHGPVKYLPGTLLKALTGVVFFAGTLLLPPLIMVRRVFLDRRIRFLVVGMLVLAAGMSIEIFLVPHYLAPFAASFYAIGLQCMRHLWVWKPGGKPVGMGMVRLLLFACVLMGAVRLFCEPLGFKIREYPPGDWTLSLYGPGAHFGEQRARIESTLEAQPGQQLVLVRYAPDHQPLNEWVYNGASIDDAKVIWAREMTPQQDAELLRYYAGRKVWLVQPDLSPAGLEPYPSAATAAISAAPQSAPKPLGAGR